ncbi:CIA30 family protein [Maribacter aestuarii]|uniref:CIA30 family protein n=1 Tax=Maribacter aestuarii TaxID=1130723 RepID=UPI00248BE13A|nr:CIA30 family protein [Maribacter aestuarii]
MNQDTSALIYNFKNHNNGKPCYIVDDGVMGGLSEGKIIVNQAGNGVFSGYVTTENNGGFSSVRYEMDKKDVSRFSKVVIKLKGDGKEYQFRIKSDASQRYSYVKSFMTSGDWELIRLSFNDFIPMFRRNTLKKPNYQGKIMEEVAFLIGNNRKENFTLEIEKIYLE